MAGGKAYAGDASGQVDPATRLPIPVKTTNGQFPKWRRKKINLQNMAYLSTPKNDHHHSTNHHDSTTDLPSKNHVQPPAFSKTPLKNARKPTKIHSEAAATFFLANMYSTR